MSETIKDHVTMQQFNELSDDEQEGIIYIMFGKAMKILRNCNLEDEPPDRYRKLRVQIDIHNVMDALGDKFYALERRFDNSEWRVTIKPDKEDIVYVCRIEIIDALWESLMYLYRRGDLN